MDPLKNDELERKAFCSNPQTNVILETGIKLGRTKVTFKTPACVIDNKLLRGKS